MDRPPHRPRFERVVEVPGHDPAEPERRTPAPVIFLSDLLLPRPHPTSSDPPAAGDERSGARAGPSLLMPRHAVVPFLGRTAELADLHMWISGPLPLSLAVVSGRGGAGKSRLAMRLCEDLSQAGWDTGLLPIHALGGALSNPATRLDALRPTLLVIDRPEPYAVLIGELIRRLAEHGANPRSRILLLPRESPDDDWWPRLTAATGGRRRPQPLEQPLFLQLDRHPLTPAERIEHARAAMQSFAPDRPDLPDPPPLDAPEYGRPLHVHVAALLRLRGDVPGSRLLSHLLAGEQEHWARTWPTTPSSLGPEPTEQKPTRREPTGQNPTEQGTSDGVTVRQAVALVTLIAPTPDELHELLAAVPGLLSPDRRLAVTRWLSGLFPGDERLSPLGPDLLAEQLLAETEGLDSLVLAVHDHGLRTSGHLVRMLENLCRASGRPTARSALHTLLVSRYAALVREAAANPILGDLLDAALRLLREDRRVAEAVTALPPWPDTPGDPTAPVARPPETRASHAVAGSPWSDPDGGAVPWSGGPLGLRGLEVTSSEIRVGRLRGRGDRMGLAEALSGLAARLAAVGRLDEAVGVAGEAVEIYAAAPPYEQAARHAGALFTLAASLLLAGEPAIAVKPAQEAAARFRILAEDDPGCTVQAERAHYNLACALISIGRLGEAVAAFRAAGGDTELSEHLEGVLPVLTRTSGDALWPESVSPSLSRPLPPPRPTPPSPSPLRPLPPPRPTPPSPLPPLAPLGADARVELGARLAVAAAVAVAGSAPTSQDVAHHLALLATRLDEQDRTEEAVVPATEAVRRLRGLAPEDPGLRLELAETAGLLARLHARLDDVATGADFAREAADNLRALAALEPGRHLHSLAWQLLDLGEYLLAEDRPEDAFPSLQQAAYLAAGLDDNHRRARARAGRLLGLCLGELNRPVDALAHLETSYALYESLGTSYRRLREGVLSAIDRMRARAADWSGAAEPSARPSTPVHDGVPGASFALLASPVPEQPAIEAAGPPTDAPEDIGAAGPSTDASEDVGAASPYVRALEVVPLPPNEIVESLLRDLGGYLRAASDVAPAEQVRPAEALAALAPALARFAGLLEQEVPLSSGAHLHDLLGDCLAGFVEASVGAGDRETAAAGANLAVRVLRSLTVADPDRYRARLGVALVTLAGLEHDLGRPDLATLEQAITLLDHEAQETQAHLRDAGEVALARALALGAAALLGQGRVVEALAHAERAADLCDELDEPVTAATAYVHLGATLAALDRPRAALEAVSWSLAEQERALSGRPDLLSVLLPLRAKADQVRGLVLRGLGRRHEGLAHLVRAVEAFRTLPRSPAQSLLEAEVATVLVDDLLEDGRADEAIGYAEVAVEGFAHFRRAGLRSEGLADGHGAALKEVLARQRLVRCLLLLGRLQEAGPLVEELVEVARRSPGDLTYRALLADSLAQSAELLPLLEPDDGSESEARARAAIWLYDELLDEGVDAQGVHTGRAGAYLSLASALALQGREAEAVQPLREVVAALERFARGHPVLTGYLARAILMLGDALLAAGRALEASVVLHRGTQVIEDELLGAVAHAQLGFCQMELRRDDAADEALQVAERLLRHLLDRGGDEDLVHILREVLRGRLDVLARAGHSDEADQVERDLADLRRFTRPPGPAGRGALPSSPR
ncbi:hypothetical protein ABT294_03990 [Nonomuraea sp. NPDC000554]|uniref:tetratricopeptide repeat protein n=1 Tax=Nonomuraea sp. NPDC000554 TaxID=3154259 RepID=UPI00331B96CC